MAGLKQPGEAPFDGVVLQVAGELARIGDAEGRGWAQVQIDAGIDEGAVLRERDAGHIEADAGRGESERRFRRYVVEGMLPSGRRVRRQDHAVPVHRGRSAQAEGGVADILVKAAAAECGERAVLLEAAGVDLDAGDPGEGLELHSLCRIGGSRRAYAQVESLLRKRP